MPDDQHDLAAAMRQRGAEMKFCRDCRHYWSRLPEWEKQYAKWSEAEKIPRSSMHLPPLPPLPPKILHACRRKVDPVTGGHFSVDARKERVPLTAYEIQVASLNRPAEPPRCGPNATFWEEKTDA